jgi:hypothetical protein
MSYIFSKREKARRICSIAVADMIDYELVNEKEIIEIIHKYRFLYKVIPYTPIDGPLGEFHKIYGALLKLNKYLNEKPKTIIALKEYMSIKDRNEQEIIDWLLKYEVLGRQLTKIYTDSFISDPEILSKGTEKLFAEFTLQVGVIDFYPLMDFVETFTSHYYKLIDKYYQTEENVPYYERDLTFFQSKEKTLIDYIAPALKMSLNDIFNNYKEPFEVKRLKHLIPIKVFQSSNTSPHLQKAHEMFHQNHFEAAILLYKDILSTRNDLHEAKAGLAISYFILEDYELAELTASDLSISQYKELKNLILKFKSSIDNGGLKDYLSFEIADGFCEESLFEEYKMKDKDKWITDYNDLYKSISISPKGLPSIANANFNGRKYNNISLFHSKYIQRLFEQNILNKVSHKEAVEYFITKMNIDGLEKILEYREYSDVEKPFFLSKLSEVFDVFKVRGNTHLIITNGICKGCQCGKEGVALIGNFDNSYLELLILTENEKVIDIFECNNFAYESYNKEYLGKRIPLKIKEYDDDLPF